MCAHYHPPTLESLKTFDRPTPNFVFSDCYPGTVGPFLSSESPGYWRPGIFGLLPSWAEPKLAKMTYNARVETVAEKPSFRHAWRKRQLAVIPVQAFFEPNYESGRAVRWRIDRVDGRPFGLAGLWESRLDSSGQATWSFTMLTINADEHPLMHRFHKPDDEKRSVVVLPDHAWSDWLSAREEGDVRAFLQQFHPGEFQGTPDPVRRNPPAPTTVGLF